LGLAEQALEIADMLVRSGSVDIVVIDSVAALTPRAEIEGEILRVLEYTRWEDIVRQRPDSSHD